MSVARRRVLMVCGVILIAAGLAGVLACGDSQAGENDGAAADSGITGTVLVDGSSTVAPITQAVAEDFQIQNRGVRVAVGISGSGGGFKKFCRGETDVSNASRPIKASEIELCKANGVEFIELPVAFDGLAVVVNPKNVFVECLTLTELGAIWNPQAEDTVTNWAQVRESFPDEALVLYGPGPDSGTYDYFTEAVVGEAGASRGDFTPSEDDNVLVQGVAGDRGALGYFGLAYFEPNRDKLKVVLIDGGEGCVEPTATTVAGGSYQPLSRPLLIYVNDKSAVERPEIDAFVRYYMEHAADLSAAVGYVPLSEEIYGLALQRYERGILGTMFEEGRQVGVSLGDVLAGP